LNFIIIPGKKQGEKRILLTPFAGPIGRGGKITAKGAKKKKNAAVGAGISEMMNFSLYLGTLNSEFGTR
jgi:hypothetical protein